jgi:hypothetical protein
VGVDSTCWLIFKGTIFIMFAMDVHDSSIGYGKQTTSRDLTTLTTIESTFMQGDGWLLGPSALDQIESIYLSDDQHMRNIKDLTSLVQSGQASVTADDFFRGACKTKVLNLL